MNYLIQADKETLESTFRNIVQEIKSEPILESIKGVNVPVDVVASIYKINRKTVIGYIKAGSIPNESKNKHYRVSLKFVLTTPYEKIKNWKQ